MIPLSPSLNIMSFLSPKKGFWDSKSGEQHFYLSRSSWSILSICMFRLKRLNQKSINVFLPNYFCNDPIPLLNQKNINLIYYEIDNNTIETPAIKTPNQFILDKCSLNKILADIAETDTIPMLLMGNTKELSG